mmetsp:Transcript_7681/g.19599  ORF Transcript_7681/g.19599 Transcript_7681/m.19599 type:complete len:686 (+) Transcript_7681:116-2173(+)
MSALRPLYPLLRLFPRANQTALHWSSLFSSSSALPMPFPPGRSVGEVDVGPLPVEVPARLLGLLVLLLLDPGLDVLVVEARHARGCQFGLLGLVRRQVLPEVRRLGVPGVVFLAGLSAASATLAGLPREVPPPVPEDDGHEVVLGAQLERAVPAEGSHAQLDSPVVEARAEEHGLDLHGVRAPEERELRAAGALAGDGLQVQHELHLVDKAQGGVRGLGGIDVLGPYGHRGEGRPKEVALLAPGRRALAPRHDAAQVHRLGPPRGRHATLQGRRVPSQGDQVRDEGAVVPLPGRHPPAPKAPDLGRHHAQARRLARSQSRAPRRRAQAHLPRERAGVCPHPARRAPGVVHVRAQRQEVRVQEARLRHRPHTHAVVRDRAQGVRVGAPRERIHHRAQLVRRPGRVRHQGHVEVPVLVQEGDLAPRRSADLAQGDLDHRHALRVHDCPVLRERRPSPAPPRLLLLHRLSCVRVEDPDVGRVRGVHHGYGVVRQRQRLLGQELGPHALELGRAHGPARVGRHLQAPRRVHRREARGGLHHQAQGRAACRVRVQARQHLRRRPVGARICAHPARRHDHHAVEGQRRLQDALPVEMKLGRHRVYRLLLRQLRASSGARGGLGVAVGQAQAVGRGELDAHGPGLDRLAQRRHDEDAARPGGHGELGPVQAPGHREHARRHRAGRAVRGRAF